VISKPKLKEGNLMKVIVQFNKKSPIEGVEYSSVGAGISIESDFFDSERTTVTSDYSLTFLFSNNSDENICQYQEMRKTKLKAMKFDKNIKFSKLEHKLLKQYLNEEI
jgi:hypothetical protein